MSRSSRKAFGSRGCPNERHPPPRSGRLRGSFLASIAIQWVDTVDDFRRAVDAFTKCARRARSLQVKSGLAHLRTRGPEMALLRTPTMSAFVPLLGTSGHQTRRNQASWFYEYTA